MFLVNQNYFVYLIIIKYFSENYRTLSNSWCWEFCEIIYWINPVKYNFDIWWGPESE